MLFTSVLLCAEVTTTNGVFYVDNDVECLLVTQGGGNTTNVLKAGMTYPVGNALIELKSTNMTSFLFSGGPLVQVSPNSIFTVIMFDQEVENIDSAPQRAKFGNHTLNLALSKGEVCILYPNKDTNSRVNVNTHYADYELSGGKYYFKLTSKGALVYVVDGGMVVHGEKSRTDVVDKGNFTLANSADTEFGLDEKVTTSFKKAKPEEMERFALPVISAEKTCSNVTFFVVDGKVIGIPLK
jgi:hypothetical protein